MKKMINCFDIKRRLKLQFYSGFNEGGLKWKDTRWYSSVPMIYSDSLGRKINQNFYFEKNYTVTCDHFLNFFYANLFVRHQLRGIEGLKTSRSNGVIWCQILDFDPKIRFRPIPEHPIVTVFLFIKPPNDYGMDQIEMVWIKEKIFGILILNTWLSWSFLI